MRVKRLMSMFLVIIMTISLCACGENNASGNSASDKSLYEQGLGVIALMAEAAQAEEYVGAYTGNPEIMEIIQNVAAGDYTTPTAVYSLSVNDEVLLSMLGLENLKGISAELKENLLSRSFGSLITQINGYAGVNNLAASSVLTLGKSFVDSSITEDVIYIYTFENAFPVAVSFTVGENGAVSAGGNFIMYEEFTCGSVAEVQEFFSEFGAVVAEVDLK
ncbi:MAG: hypothetical protein IKW08_08320 [Roseburia sp.]|nr:hypothetical protein [Roseburia sp.]